MKSFFKLIKLETKKQFEIIDITEQIKNIVQLADISNGICLVFSPHTTAAVRINHNEPLLMQDIMKTLYRLAPVDISYSHDLFEVRQNIAPNERSNGHAHVKAFLLGSSENLIIENEKLQIGDKQSVFFIELDGGRNRQIYVKILGE